MKSILDAIDEAEKKKGQIVYVHGEGGGPERL